MDKNHKKKIKNLEVLWHSFSMMTELAMEYGIQDIFQDNNAKLVQQLIYLNFKALPGREGNDALDEKNREWEMKSANEELVSGFSTHHHLNHIILAKYRKVPWSFSIYSNTNLKEIYVIQNKALEPVFSSWEGKLNGTNGKTKMESINNPKIPIKFVRSNGVLVYPYPKKPINPADVIK
jgi:hypothetical protein